MAKIKFTDLTIKHLKPANKSVEYFATGREFGDGSFGLRISPKGKKTWFAMYKNSTGKIKRYSLGTYPNLTLKEARAACSDAITAKRGGHDKQVEKMRKRDAPTMTDLWGVYQQKRSEQKKQKVARTISEENRRWEKVIEPEFGDMKVEDVTPRHLSDLLDTVVTDAPVSANRLHGLLRILFKPALQKGWITIHPMQWLDKPGGSEPPRKRVLTDDEIKTLWPLFDQLQPNPRDAFKIGLYTAQRPGEILKMRWEDIDLKAGLWTQTENKTDAIHLVPLSNQVIDILKTRQEGVGYSKKQMWMTKAEYVFPSRYNTTRKLAKNEGRAKCTKNARYQLQQLSGISDWTGHDLRRTARTIMSRLKIKHHIRERVLNHSQGGIAGVYDQFDYLQKKSDALSKLASEIDLIRGVEMVGGKIIKLQNTA